MLAEEKRREMEACAHRPGLPRLFHVAKGSQFVFNGTPATEADVDAMEQQRATWITSEPEYKRKLMVAIALIGELLPSPPCAAFIIASMSRPAGGMGGPRPSARARRQSACQRIMRPTPAEDCPWLSK